MRFKILAVIVIASLATCGITLWAGFNGQHAVAPAVAQAGGEALSPHMTLFQRHLHKLGLAIDATNQPLATFYTSKLKEDIAVVGKKVPTYDNLQIGALSQAMLGAPLTPLETALKGSDWPAINKAFDAVLTGCNSCHIATQRQYIKVTRIKANPYAQDFSK